jgi:hypothetical protein
MGELKSLKRLKGALGMEIELRLHEQSSTAK